MSIVPRNPNTILLFDGGFAPVHDNEHIASGIITPGMLIEIVPDQASAAPKYRFHTTSTEQVSIIVAGEQNWMNLGVDDDYADGDLVDAIYLKPGSIIWGLLASGQNISMGEKLQSAGDGTLKSATATTAAANVAKFQSLDNIGAVTVLTRVRAQVIQ